MDFHEFKGWEHGPSDATHFSVQDVGVPWLKVVNEGVYFALFWPHKNWKWAKYERPTKAHLAGAIVKQPIEVINGVEVDWKEAPEGTTHVVIDKVFRGWRKHTPEVVYRWVIDRWVGDGGTIPHIWLDVNKHCIFEHPNIRGNKPQAVAPKQEVPNPAPKKQAPRQVGWW